MLGRVLQYVFSEVENDKTSVHAEHRSTIGQTGLGRYRRMS